MEGFQVILMSNRLFVAFAVIRESLSRILADETGVNQGAVLVSALPI
jgi:hypothetical protein